MVTDTFKDTPPMPPHLLAIFVISDLDNITEFTKDGHMVRGIRALVVILISYLKSIK